MRAEAEKRVDPNQSISFCDEQVFDIFKNHRLELELAKFQVLRKTMPIFVMLTRLNPGAVDLPVEFEKLERKVMKRVKEDCPDVRWISSYAVLGPYDYLDIFEANDLETVARLSTLLRTFGHAQTEIWGAIEWERFKELISALPRDRTD